MTSDLRWQANTMFICKKEMAKLWLLRRMKVLKLDKNIILDYYLREVRVLVEQGVAIWNAGLTRGQINDLEKIQKAALKIILGEEYLSYTSACEQFDVIPLSERRLDLCKNYALKLYASDRSSDFFQHSTKDINTRGDQDPLLENICRTTRCYNAPHNYLTRLVNQNSDKLKQRK